MTWNCPKCSKSYDSYLSFAHHWSRGHDGTGQPLAEYLGEDKLRELYKKNSENQLAQMFDVSRTAVKKALEFSDITRRGQSSAEKHKWEKMTEEEREKQVKAAHEAARKIPRLDVSKRGYERIRHGGDEVKHHRLLATLLVDDLDELDGKSVHHKIPVWPGGPDEVAMAVNFLDNLQVTDHSDHMTHHIEEGDIPRDERTGRFTPKGSTDQ